MSDPRNGQPAEQPTPAEEPTHVDDVVGRANEGLAEAEAASRDAVTPEEAAEAHHDLSYIEAAGPEPETVREEPAVATSTAGATAAAETAVVTPSEPVAAPAETVVAPAAVAPAAEPAPQPIFVQAPEAPRPRGNRGAAGAIGLLAALVFAVLYLAAALGFGAAAGDVTAGNVAQELTAAVTSWWFWVPVVVFFLGFWLLGAIINRGRWGRWVILGLLVGAVSYGGHILGQLFQAPFWTLTASQGSDIVEEQLLAPLAIVAFILGREITIWFGAWVAARGARVTELNTEAQREYERTLEAGPQLHRL
ncbi:MAG: ABC transporter [Candidatus Microbacterium phytovorans]|uniref:ABC transporter n=1 Tax=Candidatus Microbacterium phytovorans TaxID=3121374 RepID=A0AAJ5W214_9MICO|nr:ABC transporter [Microbacterium sp.]WEK13544.1 MAG: ABC transporter [Microbacterium sp.]